MTSISFNQIPSDIRTYGQYIEFNSSRAVQGLTTQPFKALLIGQKLTAGTATALTPYLIPSASVGEALAGRGSILANMINAFKVANPYTELWAIALDDNASGVAATGTLTVTGPATASGEIALYVNGFRMGIPVASGAANTAIAAAINTELALHTDLPFTAGVATGVVTLTAKNKGTVGNVADIRLGYQQGETLPAGVGITVAQMSSGTTDPSLATAIASMGDSQYNTIVIPYADATSLTAIENELATRWGPMNAKDGQCFIGFNGTLSATTTFGITRNSPFLTIIGGGLSPTPAYIWATVAAAIEAAEPDPARPRQMMPLPGVLPPPEALRFTQSERNLLLHKGVSAYIVDQGGNVLTDNIITSYQTNATGTPDTAYYEIKTMRTGSFIRYDLKSQFALRFPRHKLADDGTNFAPGQAVVTPSVARAEILSKARDWESAGLIEDYEQFKRDLLVVRSKSDPNRLDVSAAPNYVNGFRVLATQIQFLL